MMQLHDAMACQVVGNLPQHECLRSECRIGIVCIFCGSWSRSQQLTSVPHSAMICVMCMWVVLCDVRCDASATQGMWHGVMHEVCGLCMTCEVREGWVGGLRSASGVVRSRSSCHKNSPICLFTAHPHCPPHVSATVRACCACAVPCVCVRAWCAVLCTCRACGSVALLWCCGVVCRVCVEEWRKVIQLASHC